MAEGREVASTTEDSKMGECGWRERDRERERESGVHTIKE